MRRLSPEAVELLPSVIGIVFGLVFVLANRAPLGEPGASVALVVGVLLATADLALLTVYARGPRVPAGAPRLALGDRRYLVVVAAEVVALFGGLLVINAALGRGELAVAWVALVVGVHFLALGAGRALPIVVLGAVLTVLGLLGGLLGLTTGSAAAVAGVAGIGSAVALFVAVGLDLRRRRSLAV